MSAVTSTNAEITTWNCPFKSVVWTQLKQTKCVSFPHAAQITQKRIRVWTMVTKKMTQKQLIWPVTFLPLVGEDAVNVNRLLSKQSDWHSSDKTCQRQSNTFTCFSAAQTQTELDKRVSSDTNEHKITGYSSVSLEHRSSLKQHSYICSNSQRYIVWLKVIHLYLMPKIIRILRSCYMKIFLP